MRKTTGKRDRRAESANFPRRDSDARGAALGVPEADRNECVGFYIGVGENPGTVTGEVQRRADTEVGSVTAGGEMSDDLPIVDR